MYKMYISDSIKMILENMAKSYGGSYLNKRYIDVISRKKQDSRTSEEIICDIKTKLMEIGEKNELI